MSFEKDGKYCFLWSTLAYLHPCNNSNFKKVSNYIQYYYELNINGFDFSYGFKCNDVQKVNELNKLSQNIFELNIYQAQSKWKYKLIPFEVSKNESDRGIDLQNYKNHNALNKN